MNRKIKSKTVELSPRRFDFFKACSRGTGLLNDSDYFSYSCQHIKVSRRDYFPTNMVSKDRWEPETLYGSHLEKDYVSGQTMTFDCIQQQEVVR